MEDAGKASEVGHRLMGDVAFGYPHILVINH